MAHGAIRIVTDDPLTGCLPCYSFQLEAESLPPKPAPIIPRPIPSPHLKEDCIGRRQFKWETIKQLFEEFWLDACYQNDVLRPSDPPASPNRMVLQFQQGEHYYRMAFELIRNELRPDLGPVEAWIVTIFHDGDRPALPDCPVQVLDGSYDLPEENIP